MVFMKAGEDFKKIFLVLLPFLVVAVPTLFFYAFSTDEYTYMNTARSFSHGDFYNVEYPSRFPLFSVLLAIPFFFTGASELVAKLVPIIFGALAVLVVFELGRRAYGTERGFWAGLAFSSVPAFAFLSTRVLSESLFVLLFTSCIFVLREIVIENRREKFWLLGALFGLLFLSRYNGLALALVALICLWKYGQLNLLFSRRAAEGALAFLLVLSPWMYYSYSITGSPVGLAYDFARQQVHVGQQLFMALPDRLGVPGHNWDFFFTIPAPIGLMGFVSLAVVILFISRKDFFRSICATCVEKNGFVFFAAFISVYALNLAISILHPSLMRYLLPAAPFISLIVLGAINKNDLPKYTRTIRLAVIGNILLGLFLVSLFSPFAPVKIVSYEKQVLHREAALLAANCSSIASNMRNPTLFYSGKNHTEISLLPECIALSDFEGGYIGEVPQNEGYRKVFDQGGVRLYRRFQ